MHERNCSKERSACVTFSVFARHSLGDVVYFFLCYYNMQHMQMYCLVLQKGRQSSVHVDKNVWWLDLTINNLHGL